MIRRRQLQRIMICEFNPYLILISAFDVNHGMWLRNSCKPGINLRIVLSLSLYFPILDDLYQIPHRFPSQYLEFELVSCSLYCANRYSLGSTKSTLSPGRILTGARKNCIPSAPYSLSVPRGTSVLSCSTQWRQDEVSKRFFV